MDVTNTVTNVVVYGVAGWGLMPNASRAYNNTLDSYVLRYDHTVDFDMDFADNAADSVNYMDDYVDEYILIISLVALKYFINLLLLFIGDEENMRQSEIWLRLVQELTDDNLMALYQSVLYHWIIPHILEAILGLY